MTKKLFWTNVFLGICNLFFLLNLYTNLIPKKTYNKESNVLCLQITHAWYLDNKPMFSGKIGEVNISPFCCLGDKVCNNKKEIIGSITEIKWDRLKGSLEIDFLSQDEKIIKVGEEVCVKISNQYR